MVRKNASLVGALSRLHHSYVGVAQLAERTVTICHVLSREVRFPPPALCVSSSFSFLSLVASMPTTGWMFTSTSVSCGFATGSTSFCVTRRFHEEEVVQASHPCHEVQPEPQAQVPQVVREGEPSWLTSGSRSPCVPSWYSGSCSSAPSGGGREVRGQRSWQIGDRGSHSRRSPCPAPRAVPQPRIPGGVSQRRRDHAGLSQGRGPHPDFLTARAAQHGPRTARQARRLKHQPPVTSKDDRARKERRKA